MERNQVTNDEEEVNSTANNTNIQSESTRKFPVVDEVVPNPKPLKSKMASETAKKDASKKSNTHDSFKMASENAKPAESSHTTSATSKKRQTQNVSKGPEKLLKKQKTENPVIKGVKVKQNVSKGNQVLCPSVRLRTSPNVLCNTLEKLKEPQKNVLIEMGFGSLLGMTIDELPGSLGYYVVDVLDVESLVMNCSTGSINIDRKAVHDMLGIPMGDIDLMSLPLKEVKDDEVSFSTRWKSQFNTTTIRPKQLFNVIKNSEDTGLFFKCNFLMLFTSVMISSDKSGACIVALQNAIVDRICEDTEIREIDWCGFLIQNMKDCKDVWPPPTNKDYYFRGPMTLLQLLYLDSTLCEKFPIARERPAIKYLNPTYIKERVQAEIETNGSFGQLSFQPAFSEYVVEEGFTGTTSAREVVESSSQTSNKEYHSKIEALFIQLDYTLKRGVLMFPDDLKLVELNDKFQQFFRDAKAEIPNEYDGHCFEIPNEDDGNVRDGCNDDKATGAVEDEKNNDDGAEGDQPNDDLVTLGVSCKPSEDCCFDDDDDANIGYGCNDDKAASVGDNGQDNDDGTDGDHANDDLVTPDVSGKTAKHYARKRLTKPSKYFSSPYKLMETDVNALLSILEFTVSGSVFLMQKEPSEILFETKSGKMLTRALCESLAPGICVYAAVIDIWSSILNEEQVMGGKSIRRLFLQTSTITSKMWDGSMSFDEAYEIFESNMRLTLEEKIDLLSMKNIETVFFPVVAHEHFYLVVFNLQRTAFNIIDNSAACNDYDVKYKAVCDVVRRLFSRHLEAYKHQKASAILKVKHSILKMKWRTLHNHIDCGVFLMCHMDTYTGQSVSKWNPGFVSEVSTDKVTQTLQLDKLRGKYCTKILLHDSNIHKQKIVKYSNEFKDKYNIAEGKKAIREAVSCHLNLLRV